MVMSFCGIIGQIGSFESDLKDSIIPVVTVIKSCLRATVSLYQNILASKIEI